ncbi:MAG: hypothetical protein NVS4B8_16760 [Herpetosiphon sp.]
MTKQVQIDEVLSKELIAEHDEHIRAYLLQEGIPPNPSNLGATSLSERMVKELLVELADSVG